LSVRHSVSNKPVAEIANWLGISKSSVERFHRHYITEGEIFSDNKRQGRRCTLNTEQISWLKLYVGDNNTIVLSLHARYIITMIKISLSNSERTTVKNYIECCNKHFIRGNK
jgi:transposase